MSGEVFSEAVTALVDAQIVVDAFGVVDPVTVSDAEWDRWYEANKRLWDAQRAVPVVALGRAYLAQRAQLEQLTQALKGIGLTPESLLAGVTAPKRKQQKPHKEPHDEIA